MSTPALYVTPPSIDGLIMTVGGRRVILSADLAAVYGVDTRALNQAVRRNRARFPPDFIVRVPRADAAAIARSRSQSVILKRGQNFKYLPLGFTEHGAIMAATVLNSRRAVRMSIYVVRAFVRHRLSTQTFQELRRRLDVLDGRVGRHDREVRNIVRILRGLLIEPERPRRQIGFRP